MLTSCMFYPCYKYVSYEILKYLCVVMIEHAWMLVVTSCGCSDLYGWACMDAYCDCILYSMPLHLGVTLSL